jgi:hypothetical protein
MHAELGFFMARVPQQGGVQRYRDPQRPGLSLLKTDSLTRPSEIHAATLLAIADAKGIKVTPGLVERIEEIALQREEELMASIRTRGVSDGIRSLLRAKKKKQAVRALSEMVISERDLHDFIYNSGAVGFSHWEKHVDFVPEARQLGEQERLDLWHSPRDSEANAHVWSKLEQLYVEREHRSVHLFAGSRDSWHCFFMTFRDVAGAPGSDEHHWAEGAHLHYLSHLFDPRLTKELVWEELDQRKHSLPSAHVRFHVENSSPSAQRVYLDERTGLAAIRGDGSK